MRRLGYFFANLCWMLTCLPGWLGFLTALRNPGQAQTAIKKRLRTEIKWKGGTPTSYDDYQEAIGRIMAGELTYLTVSPVKLLEPTSGSTSAGKLIAYTQSLQQEFQKAIDPWIFSLYLRRPRLLFCRHYWSISPAGSRLQVESKVPVGFATDEEYLGVMQRILARLLFPVPPEVRIIDDHSTFWFVSALFLAAEPDLGLISIWHPSFFVILIETIQAWRGEIAAILKSGILPDSLNLAPEVHSAAQARLRPTPGRARLIEGLSPKDISRLWPKLQIISCWDEGRANAEADKLRRWFPQALVQGKGLLATEGVVTIPWGDRHVAAVRSHHLEFLNQETGKILSLQELKTGQEAQVLLTTGSGFVRYRLNDLVRCTGFVGKTPTLKYLGRTDGGCDLVGEKLTPAFVEAAIAAAEGGIPLQFAMLAPTPNGRGYTLYLEDEHGREPELLAALVEEYLRTGIHYDHARCLGQLRAVVPCPMSGALQRYRTVQLVRGMKAGEIKVHALSCVPLCVHD